MIIDFHVHAFPDNLAGRAMGILSENGGLTSYTDGTVKDTAEKMRSWGIDRFVLQNISTNAKQQKNVNDFAISQNNADIISFGSVHPESDDSLNELIRLKENGIKGIKLHPVYQDFEISDKRLWPIYDMCRELSLIILFHAGIDIGFPERFLALPESSRKVVDNFPGLTIIFAHMGGFFDWDAVCEYLAGQNAYLDTAFANMGRMSKSDAERIIKKHGADKVVFASDCPWDSPELTAGFIESLDLSRTEKDLILGENARRLLNI